MKFEDLTGKIFNDFKVVERDTTKTKTAWICECLLCGNHVSVLAYNLKNGNSKNCGCKRKKATSERSRKDLTGQTINSVYVLSFDSSDKNGHSYFRCKCLICGKEFKSSGTALLTGKTKSCGCLNKKLLEEGRSQTLQEVAEFKTNIGKIRSNTLFKNNTSGVRGVHYIKSRDYWQAKITFQKKVYILKTSKDKDICIAARKEAEENLFGNFLKWYENFKNSTEES